MGMMQSRNNKSKERKIST